MLLIPAIDLLDGRCVRLFKGDFDAQTRYEDDPQELLRRYSALGAPWLHVVDLDGARNGAAANRQIVLALACKHALKLQVGGGMRSAEAIADLFAHGVDRVVVGSAAVEEPQSVIGWLERFGSERVCLAFDVSLDARAAPRVRTRGWMHSTTLSLWSAVEPFLARGLKHVLCTDIERDGTLAGPNLALYRQAAGRLPQLAWQASGGVRNAADLVALAGTGVAAAVSGRALLDGRIKPEELQAFLPSASLPVLTCVTGAS
jgi:phosphoribosylformimino-5-aminoimidazole carboxamide ribotide isomerase